MHSYKKNTAPPEGIEFSDEERDVFGAILDALMTEPSDADLSSAIFQSIKSRGLQSRVIFKKAYALLIGREHGPVLSTFLLSMGTKTHKLLAFAAGR